MTLEGKAAIVTGGAHGLGRAIALRLADDGADVMVADLLGSDAEVVAEGIRAGGRRAASFEVDVSESGAVGAMVKSAIASFGHVDILVNDAGVSGESGILEMEESFWDRVMAVNLKGNFLCSQAVARQMVARGEGGRIVNITSTAGANARPGASAYASSKAGIIQFTKTLALELGQHGITVNAVGPGMTLTGSEVKPAPTDEYQKAFVGQVPMGRPGAPTDIAAAVAFLASEDAAYINGQVIFVDGGYSAGKLSVNG
ncbi:MAG: 3-oxoacyl-ACP reductase family protein [Dehalococcoidia bacterium]|jgi:NAD(P)-dependent dehydrogenase (short-subunit alcohol dehydrogenase family)|nr:3-oxoacyl-ACP reductase family protein [Dehalococcoidia bacterium]